VPQQSGRGPPREWGGRKAGKAGGGRDSKKDTVTPGKGWEVGSYGPLGSARGCQIKEGRGQGKSSTLSKKLNSEDLVGTTEEEWTEGA